MVKWEKPEMDSWKLNTDGSYIANQGRAVDMILGNCSIPWRLQEAISQIRNNIQAHNITVQHCLREANEVADLLSKHATTLTEEVIFLWECNLPREVMGALRMDRMQVPSFRIRAEKHSAWIFHPP
ncbi:hypothetical protein FXO38_13504 [Capsicum annuum]|nr:hypothetical protein FXO38_13504 [Capsicum annuum]